MRSLREISRRILAGLAVVASVLAGTLVASVTPAYAASGRVAVVDQRHGVLIFDLADGTWNGSPRWQFHPSGNGWQNPSDVKFRTYGGRNTVLVTASGGMAATVDYATRRVTWSQYVGGNPHAMELLPGGAVVVASSTGNRLTVYGKGGHTGRTYPFGDAHAVLWNAATQRLWALGGTKLCSYAVRGTATAPTLTGKSCVDVPSGAHDLAPVHGTATQLWFSTTRHVYRYDINRGTSVRAPKYIDNRSIKSIGNQPGGLVITTQVRHGNADGTWGNGNVWLYRQDGAYVGKRSRTGAAIYKARPVVWESR
ncbi:hypothetical protein FNH05_30970 [Amycolatopsis rhizosphaerae]|uniref:PQQ-binding-like beta-propeller repeat protein n=1 Tax=Amycolatopsis rhizosphaerae TaxID=2053003 RepID=A0A558ASE0_9PSEU|nr:DUF6528 family protein [Amycolatopsis rhizosphaerae]TVT27178.1 hypothetical protein FNH05_30970 [Amycolatopsis rhizosphaerae]